MHSAGSLHDTSLHHPSLSLNEGFLTIPDNRALSSLHDPSYCATQIIDNIRKRVNNPPSEPHPRLPLCKWLMGLTGSCTLIASFTTINILEFEVFLPILAGILIAIFGRAFSIPQSKGSISVSDLFTFLFILLFKPQIAVIFAFIEALCSTRRINNKKLTCFANAGVMSVSAYLTVSVLTKCYGDINKLGPSDYSIDLICMMGLGYYFVNSILVAILISLANRESFLNTWKNVYLWYQLVPLGGALAATLIAALIHTSGVTGFISLALLSVAIYFSYTAYISNIRYASNKEVAINQDISKLSKYLAEQRDLLNEKSREYKISALYSISSVVAYRFKTTLTSILSHAQSALYLGKTADSSDKDINNIISSSIEGCKLADKLEEISSPMISQLVCPVALKSVLKKSIETTKPKWNRTRGNNKIKLELEGSDYQVIGDELNLRELFINLILNAVEAMPNGGCIRISLTLSGSWIEIVIDDNGSGISPDAIDYIFDPFFTTHAPKNLGLGLTHVYRIVQQHKGSIRVESRVGIGSRFIVKLPVYSSSFVEADAPSASVISLSEWKALNSGS
jgi:signal transduction histidine kinase